MTISKKFPLSLFLMILLAACFTSCDREEPGEMDEMYQANGQSSFVATANSSNGDGGTALGELDCFAISYPITILFPDGTTLSVDSDEALEDTIDEWYDQNEDSEDDPTLMFPIDVTLEDGTITTINDEETLCELFEECYGDDDDDEDDDEDEDEDEYEFEIEDCFEPTFPVTLILPDGSQVSMDDLDALEDAVEDYYDANPDDENEPSLVYPVEVTLDDGTVTNLNNDEELFALLENCEDDDDDEDGEDEDECFDFEYPITINFPDGTSLAVNSYDELETAEDDFEDQNPDADDDDLTLSFPVTIVFDDGSTKVVNNEDELEEAEDDCD